MIEGFEGDRRRAIIVPGVGLAEQLYSGVIIQEIEYRGCQFILMLQNQLVYVAHFVVTIFIARAEMMLM